MLSMIGKNVRLCDGITRREALRIGGLVRDILASLYRRFGIDANHLDISDRTGRPIPILPEG